MFSRTFDWIGHRILDYLAQPIAGYEPFFAPDPELLERVLLPGDVLLVEGNTRLSVIIQYLTQSTWSHAALYVGADRLGTNGKGEKLALLEATAQDGVIATPLSDYAHFNTRICRPVRVGDADRRVVIDHAVANLGKQYDVRQIVDLARYLWPYPPVPVSKRRRMLALASGDPTRAICSTMIAEAFHAIGYPILPRPGEEHAMLAGKPYVVAPYVAGEIRRIHKHGLYVPRDFDVSPYFDVVKPTIEGGFDYRKLASVEAA
ncbi:MAG TPA: YiiX/YebB-like N1pC/P60 family cysteine hydrolase [Stellaceae bacterium]|nr:YiiX/YebB-like N1pC/P60 family cysteine hydrolase [Stellaceae bacterium]